MKDQIRRIFLLMTLLLLGALTVTLVACHTEDTPDSPDSSPDTTVAVTEPATTPPADSDPSGSTTEAATTEAATTEEVTTPSLGDLIGAEAELSELNDLMQPIFSGTTVKNETVMFLDKGDTKSLLYPIQSVQSVTSYDGTVTYEEGKDYEIVDGQLKVTENSSIPCITRAVYYNAPTNMLQTSYNGQNVNTHWGEGTPMTNWQVNVNYTHNTTWTGDTQAQQSRIYENFIKKLLAGEDVTVFFYGDSITFGANASYIFNYAPYQPSYPILFVQALADLFEYTVEYQTVQVTGSQPARVPSEPYVGGTRGTITYVNTAIGGWTSQNGVDNLPAYVETPISTYGCDLFVVGFGMNDPGVDPRTTANNVKAMVESVLHIQPEASVVLVSTMVPNPNATNGWYGRQVDQQRTLTNLARQYKAQDKACALADMTTISQAVLERKEFHDYSGNNINHPNDFFARIYAQTLLQTVIGYENLA